MFKYFFKCGACKKPWAVESEIKPSEIEWSACTQNPFSEFIRPCPNCTKLPTPTNTRTFHKFMGRVKKKVFNDPRYTPCECDGRCTSAKGPNCDCSCGGKNHGQDLIITPYALNHLMEQKICQ